MPAPASSASSAPSAVSAPFPLRPRVAAVMLACLGLAGAASALAAEPASPGPAAATGTTATTTAVPGAAADTPANSPAGTGANSSQEAGIPFDVPAGSLDQVLNRFATLAGVLLSIDGSLTANQTSPGLSGTYTVAEGFAILLRRHGLRAIREAGGSYTLARIPAEGASPRLAPPADTHLPAVTVQASPLSPTSIALPYAGGQVARGGQIGLLGNRDFMETPFSVVTYTESRIADQNSDNLLGVIADSDAAVFNRGTSDGLYNDGINIRGFSIFGQEMGLNGMFGLANYSNTSIAAIAESVEVLKGPSALLYGMLPLGAVGGAVNILAKRAADEPVTRLTAGFSSDALWRAHADLGRRFGDDNRWGIRINAARTQGDTTIDQQELRNSTLGLALDFRDRRVRVAADLYRFSARVDGLSAGIALSPTLTAVPRPPRAGTLLGGEPWTLRDSADRAMMLAGEVDLTDRVTAYLRTGLRDSRYRFVGTHWTVEDLDGNASLARWRHSPQKQEARALDAGVRSRFATGAVGHQLTVGANLTELTYLRSAAGHSIYTPLAGSSNIYAPVYLDSPDIPTGIPLAKAARDRLYSVGIADTLSFLDETVQLTLGARRQTVERFAYDWTSGARSETYDASATTGTAALLVRPNDQVSIYGNYIEGLSAGATAPDGAINEGEVFPPFRSRQVEVGVKFDWGNFSTTVGAFQITQPSAFLDPVSNRFAADGRQRHRGLELGFVGEPMKGLRLIGGLAWIQARLTKTQGGLNEGKTPPGVPEWSAKLGLEHDLRALPALTLSANLIHTGGQYVNAANTLTIPGWQRVDLGGRYRTRVGDQPLTLRANILNVFDKTYWINGNLWHGVSDPRTFVLSATVDF